MPEDLVGSCAHKDVDFSPSRASSPKKNFGAIASPDSSPRSGTKGRPGRHRVSKVHNSNSEDADLAGNAKDQHDGGGKHRKRPHMGAEASTEYSPMPSKGSTSDMVRPFVAEAQDCSPCPSKGSASDPVRSFSSDQGEDVETKDCFAVSQRKASKGSKHSSPKAQSSWKGTLDFQSSMAKEEDRPQAAPAPQSERSPQPDTKPTIIVVEASAGSRDGGAPQRSKVPAEAAAGALSPVGGGVGFSHDQDDDEPPSRTLAPPIKSASSRWRSPSSLWRSKTPTQDVPQSSASSRWRSPSAFWSTKTIPKEVAEPSSPVESRPKSSLSFGWKSPSAFWGSNAASKTGVKPLSAMDAPSKESAMSRWRSPSALWRSKTSSQERGDFVGARRAQTLSPSVSSPVSADSDDEHPSPLPQAAEDPRSCTSHSQKELHSQTAVPQKSSSSRWKLPSFRGCAKDSAEHEVQPKESGSSRWTGPRLLWSSKDPGATAKECTPSASSGARQSQGPSLDENAAPDRSQQQHVQKASSTPRRSGTPKRSLAETFAFHRRFLRRGRREGDVHKAFTWSESDELGRGSYGRVFRGRSMYDSQRTVAVKQIARSSVQDAEQLWSEIGILSELDHPNVLRLLEAYEDAQNFYIVTEVCTGGNLAEAFDALQGNETFAVRLGREITGALAHCHASGICHRDLKPENILLVNKSHDSPVRIADFGLAKRSNRLIRQRTTTWSKVKAEQESCASTGTPSAASDRRGQHSGNSVVRDGIKPCNSGNNSSDDEGASHSRTVKPPPRASARFTTWAGTPEYMAPEVVRILDAQLSGGGARGRTKFYDFRCDVWSLGVIVFTLLTGVPPYTLEEVSAYVAEGRELPELDWMDSVSQLKLRSPKAVDFVRGCLKADFERRPSAEELLQHPWLAEQPEAAKLPQAPCPEDLLGRFRTFSRLSPFKQAALTASTRHMRAYEHEQLRSVFQSLDEDNSGSLSRKELKKYLRQAASSASIDLEQLFRVIDSDKSGEVDFTEFLAATMDPRIHERHDLAWAAFCAFDQNGAGYVSGSDLQRVLGPGVADELMKRASSNSGIIDFDSFLLLLGES